VTLGSVQPSTFNLRPSTFDLRPSTFDLRPSTFEPSGHDNAMVAWLVRKRTSVTRDWVTERLVMGHPSSVSRAVRTVREDAKLGRKANRL
jgi:hypothetical protein